MDEANRLPWHIMVTVEESLSPYENNIRELQHVQHCVFLLGCAQWILFIWVSYVSFSS